MRRFDVLLMLAALTFAAIALIGASASARELGHEPKFRARSRSRASRLAVVALSVFTLGALIARSAHRLAIRFPLRLAPAEEGATHAARVFSSITPPHSGGRNVRLLQSHALFCVDRGWKGRGRGWPKSAQSGTSLTL